jgi:DnaJ-class molecular chaperone
VNPRSSAHGTKFSSRRNKGNEDKIDVTRKPGFHFQRHPCREGAKRARYRHKTAKNRLAAEVMECVADATRMCSFPHPVTCEKCKSAGMVMNYRVLLQC